MELDSPWTARYTRQQMNNYNILLSKNNNSTNKSKNTVMLHDHCETYHYTLGHLRLEL